MADKAPAREVWLTPAEVRDQLKISTTKIYLEIKLGRMPHIRLGKTIRIPESKLATWLQSKKA